MFYIRTDANKEIASGHVMRCIAIARQIEKAGEPCAFVAADEDSRALVEDNGFSFICLNSDWKQPESELETLLSLIKENDIKVLLLDSYQVTKRYLSILSQYTKIIYMDDRNQFIYPVDTVINYGVQSGAFHYEENYRNSLEGKNTRFLLGCEYIPLREEFCGRERASVKELTDILITTGGTDPYNMAGRLARLLGNTDYRLHVVSGRMNQSLETLQETCDQHPNVTLYVNTNRMSDLMRKCDFAISAAGTTLYELCACQTPAVSFSFADNQMEGALQLDRLGVIPYAGDIRADSDCRMEKILSMLEEMKKNPHMRKDKMIKMKALVDGKGASRIAAYCLGRS